MNREKILLADDSELNRAILMDVMGQDYPIIEAANGREAIEALQAHSGEIGVVLLDVVMPEADGFAVLEYMNIKGLVEDIPVIMISAETSGAYIDRAFKLGAADYVSRPFVPSVISRRVLNAVLLHTKKQQLLDYVASRFYQEEKNNEMMGAILGHVVEVRSGEGGSHMPHVEFITGLLLQRLVSKTGRYNLDRSDIDAIRMSSGLHDIGKLMIPGELLRKPGPLLPEEYEVVKQHTVIGAKLFTELPIYQNERLIKYAIEICRWHHERWEGEGYPDGLRGEEIPISAQVVAVADVYDALTSERCYKRAVPHQQAMHMIHSGQCGTFNPLLLECLDDLAGRIEKETGGHRTVSQSWRAARRVVEELYSSPSISASRVAMQLEEEQTKRRFFSELTNELWFEYTRHPAALVLSDSAVRMTGLPGVVVAPLEDKAVLGVAEREALRDIARRVDALSEDETYLELEMPLMIGGVSRWCQLAILVTYSPDEPGQYASFLGKVIDIDGRQRTLETYAQAVRESHGATLTPMLAEGEDVVRVTGEELGGVLRGYRRMFEIVRLVDPVTCMQLNLKGERVTTDKDPHCYAVWDRMKRCERCISQDVLATGKPQSKIETANNEVFYVLASRLEVDGVPYVLELVNQIRSDDMAGPADTGSVLSQLLIRNRQVYMDSVTKVYNRRYYDDQLRNLDGEFAVAMIDLDNFKQINDQYGHMAGDAALYRAAQAIKSAIRSNDELVRYGGDEFFLLFHDLPRDILEKKLQDILAAMEKVQFAEYPGLRITGSIGGVHTAGKVSQSIRLADIAMYQAKKTKDCVAIYTGNEKIT